MRGREGERVRGREGERERGGEGERVRGREGDVIQLSSQNDNRAICHITAVNYS